MFVNARHRYRPDASATTIPSEVGADRIVNAVAAFQKYGGPCVVVDLGTAITFDACLRNAEYLGGIICPGIGISMEALFSRAARLPPGRFPRAAKADRHQHRGSMQSGFYYGAIGMIDGILERLIAELGPNTNGHRHRRPGRPDRAQARAI